MIKFDVAVLSLFGSTANHHMGIITTDSVYISCMLQQNLLVADGKTHTAYYTACQQNNSI